MIRSPYEPLTSDTVGSSAKYACAELNARPCFLPLNPPKCILFRTPNPKAHFHLEKKIFH